jgi:hypothetical protein
MGTFDSVYKNKIRQLEEENNKLKTALRMIFEADGDYDIFPLNEYSGSPNYAERLREIEKTPAPVYPGENASPGQIKKWKDDTAQWAFDQRRLAAAMKRSATSNMHPVAQPFHDTQVAMGQTIAIDKRIKERKASSYPGQHPVRK